MKLFSSFFLLLEEEIINKKRLAQQHGQVYLSLENTTKPLTVTVFSVIVFDNIQPLSTTSTTYYCNLTIM